MNNYVFYLRGKKEQYYKGLVPLSVQVLAIAMLYSSELSNADYFCDDIPTGIKKKKRKRMYSAFRKMMSFLEENPCKTNIFAFSRDTFPDGEKTEIELLKKGYTIYYIDKKIWTL